MKHIVSLLSAVCFFWLSAFSQGDEIRNYRIQEMKWGLDYQVYLKMENDTSYAMDIGNLFHVARTQDNFESEFVFYPATLDETYTQTIHSQNPDVQMNDASIPGKEALDKTLWSAINASIGGNWTQFSNAIMYSLESGNLNLQAMFLERPKTKWKPNPMTTSYKRTKKWKYAFPVKQCQAKKEYRKRKKEGTLGDVNSLPHQYVRLFLKTSNCKYKKLVKKNQTDKLAQINLVKVMLGSIYLGEPQIRYVKNCVLYSIRKYKVPRLPTVIIFDEFNAAAILSLNESGYKLEKIAFKSDEQISEQEMIARETKIRDAIEKINEYNNKQFQKRLGNYFKK